MKKEEREKQIKELQEKVWNEVRSYFANPEEVIEYIEFLNKFHDYSVRNRMMIHAQRQGAVAVGTYKFFERLGYKVNRGEKGIKIVRPIVTKFVRRGSEYVALNKATAEELSEIKAGKKRVHEYVSYMLMTVFDVLQTNMPKEEYPKIFPNAHKEHKVTGELDGEEIMKKLGKVGKKIDVAYKEVETEEWQGGTAHGYYSIYDKEIVLNPNNTETEKIAVGIHELAHAILHGGKNKIQEELKIKEEDMNAQERELQAEMTAYLVANFLGIDTKETTTQYLGVWTKRGKDIKKEKIEKLFTEIIKVSEYLIERLGK